MARSLAPRVLILFAFVIAMMPLNSVPAQEPVKIRIPITDTGFDSHPDDYTIEVEQGTLVEITFVWSHQAYPREEHIIVFEGYKVETDKINADHRESTVKFIADKSGTFGFKCDIECDLHDHLQKGILKVTPRGGAGGGASFTATKLDLKPSTYATGGDPVNITAMLRDVKGTPVPKADIVFTLAAEFVGTKGDMVIGSARTDTNGIAFFEFKPTFGMKEQKVTAHFSRMGIYDQSDGSVTVEEVDVQPAAYESTPVGLESVAQWAPLLLLVVVLGVWLTLAYVFYQVIAIARLGRTK
jgi:hypothetical protein